MNIRQILKDHLEYLQTGDDSKRAYLRGANLSGADLSGADLSGADLSGADLSGADLSGADLSGADLSRANLSGANLVGASLNSANLSGANLNEACLIGADLSFTTLKAFYFGVHFAFYHEGYLRIGCQGMHIKEWLTSYKEIGKKGGYTDKQIEEYGLLIEFINLMESA